MNAFHNSVKYDIYSRYAKNTNLIIELGGGHANDLHRWIKYKIKNVIVVDNDIIEIQEGQKRRENMPPGIPNVRFVLDDINDPHIVYSETQADVVFCNFAIHYFLKNDLSIKNFKGIIDKYLLKNGHFVFMALDGRRVFDALTHGDIIFDNISIVKKYNDLVIKEFGQEIQVNKTTKEYHEYLVNFEYLKSIFNEYKIIEDRMFIPRFKMTNGEMFYSRLNRYVVLLKK